MTDKTLRCYELPEMFRATMDRAVDPDTGELTEAGIAEIRALTAAANHSTADLACYIRELEMEADAVKSALSAMADRASRLLTRASKWRGYLLETMDAIGSTSIKDARIAVTVKTNPPSVQVDEDVDLPLGYCRLIPARTEPDKNLLKAALKTGEVIPGVSLVATRRLAIQ
jgi:hypothetical protein